MKRWAFLLLLIPAAACTKAPRVRFDNDTCIIDGLPAGIERVEAEEAQISRHMAQRQPLFLLITAMVVILASAGYVLRIIDALAAPNKDGLSFAGRLRQGLERHRAHPVRYFAMVSGAFALLIVACGVYASLDSDKLASERALGQLQFCHLALRTADENHVLVEQRQNLEALSATAGHIRTLVDQLPPDEQKKAQLVIDQVSSALDKQNKALSDSLERNARAADEALRDQTVQVERGLSDVEANVQTLKSVPDDLAELEKAQQELSAELADVGAKVDRDARADAVAAERADIAALSKKLDGQIAALGQQLAALEVRARPASPPPLQVAAKSQAIAAGSSKN